MSTQFEPMVNLIPARSQGVARIDHFEVSKAEATVSSIRALATRGREMGVMAGKYARLVVEGRLYMTDTQMEQVTNGAFLRNAKGNVLIAGLGLGMVLVPLLKNPDVNTILVLEKYQDVIDLVAPSFKEAIDDERLHIFNEDVTTWRPETDWEWDTIFFDIWPDICPDNMEQMRKLENRHRFHLAEGGWMESWSKREMRRNTRFGRPVEDFEDEESEEGG